MSVGVGYVGEVPIVDVDRGLCPTNCRPAADVHGCPTGNLEDFPVSGVADEGPVGWHRVHVSVDTSHVVDVPLVDVDVPSTAVELGAVAYVQRCTSRHDVDAPGLG